MYKLDVISNGSKDYINLYKKNLNFSNKIINKIKEKRNSLDISHISKKSKNSQKKTNISENSLSNNNLNNIQRIKFFVQKKENSFNKGKNYNSNSFKGNNIPMCLSLMTNSKNLKDVIDKKFRVRNILNFIDNMAISDNNNNSSLMINNSMFEKNVKKNIFNLKYINNKRAKKIKKIMSTINFSRNNKKEQNFLDRSNSLNSAVNIKNYNYFIGTIDKSVNIYDQPQIFKKKEKIHKLKKIEKLGNKNLDELGRPKINYMDLLLNTNIKLNLPKNKLQKLNIKKFNYNLNISADNDINNKETTINDSKLSLKLKNSSKLQIPKLGINFDNKSNKSAKKEEKIIPKKIEKTGNGGISLTKNKIKNSIDENKQKNSKRKTVPSNKEEKKGKDENKDKSKNKKKKNAKRRSSLFEKILEKISCLRKKAEEKDKIKFSNLSVINHVKNINEKKNQFLTKITEHNGISEKLKDNKYVKDYKNRIILAKKKFIDKIISNQNEKLNFNSFNFFSRHLDKITIKKSILLNKEKLINYKSTIITLRRNDFLEKYKYSIISLMNKCGLDFNLKTYIVSNLDFSSLNLAKIEPDDTIKQSFLLNTLGYKRHKKDAIFVIHKGKFIESRRYKYNNATQTFSLNLIQKELEFYNILKNVNFLAQENNIYKDDKSVKINQALTSAFKTGNLRKKRSVGFTTKKIKFTSRKIIKSITHQHNSLSVLEDRKFYNQDKNNIAKKFRNSMHGNVLWNKVVSKVDFKKILTKGFANKDISDVNLQKEYQYMNKVMKSIYARKFSKDMSYNKYELLKLIKDKQNIESILRLFILKGEIILFMDYFNEVYKKIDINSRDEEGNTFLILSVKSGNNRISKMLLEKGANTNIQNYEGNAALHFALSRKNFEMADLLKVYGAKEDLTNKKGYNPWECVGKSIEGVD